MRYTINFRLGQRFILAALIPKGIAEGLVPLRDYGPPVLVDLQKKIPQTEPGNFRIEALNGADIAMLEAIWRDLPGPSPIKLLVGHDAKRALTSVDFAPFAEACSAASNRPAWDLQPAFIDQRGVEDAERQQIRREHWDELERRARKGVLRLLSANGVPTNKIEPGTTLSVKDARAYLEDVPPGFTLRAHNPAGDIFAAMNRSIEQRAAEALAEGYRPPEGPYRRTLPNGKRFFTVDEAAMETALALHPKQRDDPTGAKVKGFYLHEVACPSREANLTDEQTREIGEVWRAAYLPDPAFPMERYTFDAYALALSRSELGRTWALGANLTSRETHAAILRTATMAAHVELLRKAIAAGTVTALHPATKTPIGAAAASASALIRMADLLKFAASLPEPIELLALEDAPPPEPSLESAPAERAATIAEQGTPAEQFKNAQGNIPRRAALARAMLKECQDNMTEAARRLGTYRQTIDRVLRKDAVHSAAGVAPMYAQLARKPHKT